VSYYRGQLFYVAHGSRSAYEKEDLASGAWCVGQRHGQQSQQLLSSCFSLFIG